MKGSSVVSTARALILPPSVKVSQLESVECAS